MSMRSFVSRQLLQIPQGSKVDPPRRARLCLHHDPRDKVQEMVIAFSRNPYVRPHRHVNKRESFHVIEGEMAVVFFDDSGRVTRHIRMGPLGSGHAFLYRSSSSLWHTVVPLSEFVIIHETTNGPFVREETEFATWGPDESDAGGIRALMARIATGYAREFQSPIH